MKITNEIELRDFEAWSGGKDTLNRLIELGVVDEFQQNIEDTYPDGIDATELNDILWFEDGEGGFIENCLGFNIWDKDMEVE